jgi:mono/diheme cytochrome c family protein
MTMKAENRIQGTHKIFIMIAPTVACLLLLSFSFQGDKWKAPPEADNLKNPFSLTDEKALAKGEKVFSKACWTCHGQTGTGDGPAGVNLNPSPGDFTTDVFAAQSDGAIYWKITQGRGFMASYEDVLSEDDRWKLVLYLRELGK